MAEPENAVFSNQGVFLLSEIPFVEFLSLFVLVKVMVSSESNSENYIVQIKINIFKQQFSATSYACF